MSWPICRGGFHDSFRLSPTCRHWTRVALPVSCLHPQHLSSSYFLTVSPSCVHSYIDRQSCRSDRRLVFVLRLGPSIDGQERDPCVTTLRFERLLSVRALSNTLTLCLNVTLLRLTDCKIFSVTQSVTPTPNQGMVLGLTLYRRPVVLIGHP